MFPHLSAGNEIRLDHSHAVQLADNAVFPPLAGLFRQFACFLDDGQPLHFGRAEKIVIIRGGGKRTSAAVSPCCLSAASLSALLCFLPGRQ